jgi:hypothetical protein
VLEPGEKTFVIKIEDREDRVSVDRLKPHFGKEPVQRAVPCRRGRPKTKQDAADVEPPPRTWESSLVGAPL